MLAIVSSYRFYWYRFYWAEAFFCRLPRIVSAHGSLSTAVCVGCKLLELVFFYAQAAAVSSSVLGFLFMQFYCLRQGNIVGIPSKNTSIYT